MSKRREPRWTLPFPGAVGCDGILAATGFGSGSPAYVLAESHDTVPLILRRDPSISHPATYSVQVSGGSATEGEDFTLLETRVTFEAGSDSQRFTIGVPVDGIREGDETVKLHFIEEGVGAEHRIELTLTDGEIDLHLDPSFHPELQLTERVVAAAIAPDGGVCPGLH